MKIIQTFWSKPLFHSNQNVCQNRYQGGWLNYRYFLLSMAYSCLTISRYYPHLELYTDTFGKSLFKDILQLPYYRYHTILDDLSEVDEDFGHSLKSKHILFRMSHFCMLTMMFLFGTVPPEYN